MTTNESREGLLKLLKPLLTISLAASHLVFFPLAWAVPAEDEIYSIVEAYPRSQVELQEERKVVDYPIALAQIKKSRGIWAPDKERRLAGDLLRRTVQIPEGHSAKEVFEFYHNRLLNNNARVLYLCEARNCGASNSWANEFFQIKQLYGLDAEQYYATYEIVDSKGLLNYVALYTVARGNKRVFAHVELLSTSVSDQDSLAPEPKAVLRQLSNNGYYIVSGVSLDDGKLSIKPEHFEAMVTALQIERSRKVHIVGHIYNSSPLSAQFNESLSLAKQLLDAFIAAGISEDRMESHGLGSLAPTRKSLAAEAQGQRFRIELVAPQ